MTSQQHAFETGHRFPYHFWLVLPEGSVCYAVPEQLPVQVKWHCLTCGKKDWEMGAPGEAG